MDERLTSSPSPMAKLFFLLFPRSSKKSRTFAQTGQVCHGVLLSLCVKWKGLGKRVVNDSSLRFLGIGRLCLGALHTQADSENHDDWC